MGELIEVLGANRRLELCRNHRYLEEANPPTNLSCEATK